jgi:uncharacterized protein (DUF1499 family)
MMQLARKPMLMVLITAASVVAAIAITALTLLLLQIEDWHRDLTTNSAATDAQSRDERLRPIRSMLPPDHLADLVVEAMQPRNNWKLQSRTPHAERIDLHFVRTTPWLRFQDDIRVQIELAPGGGSFLNANSQSRIGKGDLGQNPRNLRELLAAVRGATG